MLALTFWGRGYSGAQRSSSAQLPEAPEPQTPSRFAVSPIKTASYEKRKWASIVDPGEEIPPLSRRDKLMFWLHVEKRPLAQVPEFMAAAYSQGVQTDPRFGSDSAGFGERLGASYLRDAGMRFFSDSVLPAMTHEDPRYYRKAAGSYGARSWYAVEHVALSHRDDGETGFNTSGVLGRLFGSALTVTYYPHVSANGNVVFRTWGTALAGQAGNNLFLEFLPDVLNRIGHRKLANERF